MRQHARDSMQVIAEHLLFQLLQACSTQPHEVSLLLDRQLHILGCCDPSIGVLPALNVATPARHKTPPVGIRTHSTPGWMRHEKGIALW